eukprot:5895484-Amphidinium_carterae.1
MAKQQKPSNLITAQGRSASVPTAQTLCMALSFCKHEVTLKPALCKRREQSDVARRGFTSIRPFNMEQ